MVDYMIHYSKHFLSRGCKILNCFTENFCYFFIWQAPVLVIKESTYFLTVDFICP